MGSSATGIEAEQVRDALRPLGIADHESKQAEVFSVFAPSSLK